MHSKGRGKEHAREEIPAHNRLKGKFYISNNVKNFLSHYEGLSPILVPAMLELFTQQFLAGDILFTDNGLRCCSKSKNIDLKLFGDQ